MDTIRSLFSFRVGNTLLLSVFLFGQLTATEPPKKKDVKKSSVASKLMGCEPPLAYTEFALNNVRFGLESSGKLWNKGGASYEVPKLDPASAEPSIHSIYAGGLWIGGKSDDGNLKVATVTFRENGQTDYYSGPLSTNGYATADYCEEYDRFFHANKTDVSIHRAYHTALALQDGSVDQLFPDGYQMPDYFNEWPGNNTDPNYNYQLAPFHDVNDDLEYSPEQGDYPDYDLDGAIDCKSRNRTDQVPLFGDETLWWVFNDNGGIHTQSEGEPIGIEIQAQAFAYSTADEINNMTFYNYVLINRGQQTLTDTYYGQWMDTDLGCPEDDYVGCDVQRGMGYTYNGTETDASCLGTNGYGSQPPALGVDFFEGPYQDSDDYFDNPFSEDLQLVFDENGIPYSGIGIGYGDGVTENERFGMKRFVYYNRGDDQTNGDPRNPIDYYNYMDGKWKTGEQMTYGGNGIGGDTPCNYMFPGDTDPLGYGVYPQTVDEDWSEENNLIDDNGNAPGDRRFIQSAGKFTLEPGEFNNITTGVVWVRPFANRERTLLALSIADDKAQALFDNCFQILSGPDAPDLSAQELDREIILYLSNENPNSNNYHESYGRPPTNASFDILIPELTSTGDIIPEDDKHYKFQGYMIYQLKNATISSAELNNPDLARLQAQVDISDGVAQLVNWEDDPQLGFRVPVEKVFGADEGIRHSFSIKEDLFSGGERRLVNFKKYYFMAIAYAHNEYEAFNPGTGIGQPRTFLGSRKTANGGIPVVTGIPHDPTTEAGGTIQQSEYGDILPVTRVEGEGNGGAILDISSQSEQEILSADFHFVDKVLYQVGASPIKIKVVDPLNIPNGEFRLAFYTDYEDGIDGATDDWEIESEHIKWYLMDKDDPTKKVYSHQAIDIGGEQLILKYGLSLDITQYEYERIAGTNFSTLDLLESSMIYEGDGPRWLSGVSDVDLPTEQNWIRSGGQTDFNGDCDDADPNSECYHLDKTDIDPDERFENILAGTVAPWHLVAQSWSGPAYVEEDFQLWQTTKITSLSSTDVVFTSDKENWTRVPVLEIQQFKEMSKGGAEKLHRRIDLSVDKDGKNQLNGGDISECTMNGTQVLTAIELAELSSLKRTEYKSSAWPGEDPETHQDEELIGLSFGMGWFPGYAIDIESGERLNMAFGENSALAVENGSDMIWNPTTTIWNEFAEVQFDPSAARFGGMHYYYVFRNHSRQDLNEERMPRYDHGQFMYHHLESGNTARQRVFRSCTWVGLPLLSEGAAFRSMEEGLIPTDVRIRLRVAKPYARMATVAEFYSDYLFLDDEQPWTQTFPVFNWDENSGVTYEDDFQAGDFPPGTVPAIRYSQNDWLPLYDFETSSFSTSTQVAQVLENSLDMRDINVVPNPYYGASDYEVTRLDNRVKIINLPERCIIKIYNTSGSLIRTLDKDSKETFLDWNLKNASNVPISGGVHIFHIEVPGIGETIVKWMGVMRPVDLNNF